jgi:Holliday junction resolvasome RuvABC endonuclease subunit
MGKRILAIDQSSRTSGWAIFDDKILENYGKFHYDDLDPILRIIKLKSDIKNLVLQNNIDEIILEDIQQQASVTTYKILAYVLGNLETLFAENGWKYQLTSSSTWKSFCGVKGKGRAEQKKNAQLFVLDTFGVKTIQDTVDAICIGWSKVHEKDSAW